MPSPLAVVVASGFDGDVSIALAVVFLPCSDTDFGLA